jgi:hypothetical protein
LIDERKDFVAEAHGLLIHTGRMSHDDLQRVAELLHERDRIDDQIAAIMERPMTSGHLGEWIAAQVFDIELERSATTTAFDGRFRSGPLQGRTVNVKWYLNREGLLDMTTSEALDDYLVLTGRVSAAVSSHGRTRPWCIVSVYLFDAHGLRAEMLAPLLLPLSQSSPIAGASAPSHASDCADEAPVTRHHELRDSRVQEV